MILCFRSRELQHWLSQQLAWRQILRSGFSLKLTHTHTHTLPFSLQACRVPDCGFDAGDCGTDLWESLYSVVPRPNHTHLIPAGITAMFFNLTTYFTNGTISLAEHTPCPVLRTAVMAQTFKTLSLTFTRNTSHCISNITINGTSGSGGVVTVSPAHSHYCCNYRGPLFRSSLACLLILQ